MKLSTLALGLSLSLSSLAADIPADAKNIRFTHVSVGMVGTEFVEVDCGSGFDITCYRPVAFKKMVEVTADYSNGASIPEETSFSQKFDAADFTEEQLRRLKSRSLKTRMNAVREIFALDIKDERRTGSYQACGYEEGCTAEELEHWTYTYDNMVKNVSIIRK